MESTHNQAVVARSRLSRMGRGVGFGTMLAISCLISYWLITNILARRLSQTTYKLHPYERNYEHAITRTKGVQELTLPAKLELVQGNLN